MSRVREPAQRAVDVREVVVVTEEIELFPPGLQRDGDVGGVELAEVVLRYVQLFSQIGCGEDVLVEGWEGGEVGVGAGEEGGGAFELGVAEEEEAEGRGWGW